MDYTQQKLNDAKEWIKLYEAALAGKIIQIKSTLSGNWSDLSSTCISWTDSLQNYRIKPEPTVRPYRNIDEAKAALNKVIVGVMYQWEVIGVSNTQLITTAYKNNNIISSCMVFDFDSFLPECYKFTDGTRVGVVE